MWEKLFLLLCFVCALGQEEEERKPVKLCVLREQEEPCRKMEQDVPGTWQCVTARDKLDCARKLESGEAELANMDTRALYVSGKYFSGVPIATEIVDGQPHKYEGVALVKTDSNIRSLEDLRGRRSCHTGVGRTVGWQLPIASLMAKGVMQPDCEEGELKAVETFFSGGSCAPGNWSSDPIVDAGLKSRYSGLCSRCSNPTTCASDDAYAGYEGSVRCLLDNSGDIAFTKVPVLMDLMQKDATLSENLQLLCLDGTRRSLTSDHEPCVWGFRPSNAYVTSQATKEKDLSRLLAALERTQALFIAPQRRHLTWFYKVFFSSSKVNSLQPVGEDRSDYRSYMGDFINAIDKSRAGCPDPPPTVTYCATSDNERTKCEDYAKALESRGLSPGVRCVVTSSKAACMEALKMGNADFVTLDGGDVYKAGRYFDLLPVSAEVYGNLDASYFAVAVIRSASDVTKLSDLRGLRSCHTGIGRTAGWVVPVGALIESGSLTPDECNRALAVSEFFTDGSCVPGANDTKFNPGRKGAEKLCRQCIGDENGQFKCARDSKERYSGYAGAFRCLAEGRGDVAFVKHTTVPENTDKGTGDLWSRDLLSSDFQLLCGHGGTAPVEQYSHCNLAKVPSHYVMTNADATPLKRLQLARLLADSSKLFSDSSELFRLFEKYSDGQSDLLFKDSATALKAAPLTTTYTDVLGQEFLKASEAVDPKACNGN